VAPANTGEQAWAAAPVRDSNKAGQGGPLRNSRRAGRASHGGGMGAGSCEAAGRGRREGSGPRGALGAAAAGRREQVNGGEVLRIRFQVYIARVARWAFIGLKISGPQWSSAG
jgi:hypothetical protein